MNRSTFGCRVIFSCAIAFFAWGCTSGAPLCMNTVTGALSPPRLVPSYSCHNSPPSVMVLPRSYGNDTPLVLPIVTT